MNSISNFKQKLTNESPTANNIGDLSILRRLPKRHAFFLRAKMMMELGREENARRYAKKSIECDLKKEEFLDAAEKAKMFKFPELVQKAGEGFYQYTVDWDAEINPGFANLVAIEVMREYGVTQEFVSEANLRFEIRILLECDKMGKAEELASERGRPGLVDEIAESRRAARRPLDCYFGEEHFISSSAKLEEFTPELLQELEKGQSRIEGHPSRLIELAREAKGKGMEELGVRLASLSVRAKLADWGVSRHMRNAAAAEAEEFGQAGLIREIGFKLIEDALTNKDVSELRAIAAKSGISEQELVFHVTQSVDKEIRDDCSKVFAWLKPVSEGLGLYVQLKAISLIKDLPVPPCSLNIFGENR